MTLVDLILTVVIQTIFCLGFRTLLSEGMILHFLRKPFENMKRPTILAKPIILCVVCFSSFWGGILFIYMHGPLITELIISCISSAFLIKFVNDKVDW